MRYIHALILLTISTAMIFPDETENKFATLFNTKHEKTLSNIYTSWQQLQGTHIPAYIDADEISACLTSLNILLHNNENDQITHVIGKNFKELDCKRKLLHSNPIGCTTCVGLEWDEDKSFESACEHYDYHQYDIKKVENKIGALLDRNTK